jgi:hypothetical protein
MEKPSHRGDPTGLLHRLARAVLLPAAFLLLTAQAPPSDPASRELRLEIKQAEDRAAERAAALERRIEEFERQTWIVGAGVEVGTDQ